MDVSATIFMTSFDQKKRSLLKMINNPTIGVNNVYFERRQRWEYWEWYIAYFSRMKMTSKRGLVAAGKLSS